jgi:hypothetical protein
MAAVLVSAAILAIVFLVPALSLVGVWLGARRLSRRSGLPRFVTWVAYALVTPAVLFVIVGVVGGLLRSLVA